MRAVEERDELEIETRLRTALQARSELVTHSTLRPGIPPNEHTAGVRAKRDAWWSWRRMWVPVTVAAALAGGVFAGAQLPSDSGSGNAVSPGSSAGSTGGPSTGGVPTGSNPTAAQNAGQAGTASNLGTIGFTLADGWQLTSLSSTTGCVTLKTRPAPTPVAAGAQALPCGVDGIYLASAATATTWPLSTAAKDTGWWPAGAASASAITCPGASGSSDMVKTSVLLRSSPKYALAGSTTAVYDEWAVTCATGSGAQPMLWKLNAAPGAPAPTTFAVAAVVSVDPANDSALLGMVSSLHQAS